MTALSSLIQGRSIMQVEDNFSFDDIFLSVNSFNKISCNDFNRFRGGSIALISKLPFSSISKIESIGIK
jgi:hypothetical protein